MMYAPKIQYKTPKDLLSLFFTHGECTSVVINGETFQLVVPDVRRSFRQVIRQRGDRQNAWRMSFLVSQPYLWVTFKMGVLSYGRCFQFPICLSLAPLLWWSKRPERSFSILIWSKEEDNSRKGHLRCPCRGLTLVGLWTLITIAFGAWMSYHFNHERPEQKTNGLGNTLGSTCFCSFGFFTYKRYWGLFRIYDWRYSNCLTRCCGLCL